MADSQTYVPLMGALASVFTIVGLMAGFAATASERNGGSARGEAVDLRMRLAGRYRAHPRAMKLQIACLAAAGALLLAAFILLLA
jgi:hypothetical protein